MQSFNFFAQNSVSLNVNRPKYSGENKMEILNPAGTVVLSITDNYENATDSAFLDEDANIVPLPDGSYTTGVYDNYVDDWNRTAPHDKVFINGNEEFNFDGNITNHTTVNEEITLDFPLLIETPDNASFSYDTNSYPISGSDPTPIITGESGGTFSSTSGLSINSSTGLIDVSNSSLGSYTVTYTTNAPGQNSSQENITISFATSQYFDSSKKYIEYIPGTMPVIISAPHGGVLQSGRSFGGISYPDNDRSLPDRRCGTNEQDDNTDVLIKEIQKRCFEQFGEYPYIIVSNLHRSKLDPNRNKSVATCNNSTAGQYFDAYHNFIDQASADVTTKFGKGLYIDLHGQSHSIPRVEAGYNLTRNSFDENLNNTRTNAVELSRVTIKNLIENNIQNLTFEDLIRGSQSFGGLLQTTGGAEYAALGHSGCSRNVGYRTVPSHISSGNSQGNCDDTNPGNNPYFAGDYYSNIRHGSGDTNRANTVVQGGGTVNGGGGTIDGIMTEVNRRVRDMGTLLTAYDGRQDSRSSTIPFFARDYAQVIEKYIDLHYNDFSNFSYASSSYDVSDTNPTPTINGISGGIFTANSGLVINANTGEIDLSNSNAGNYIVTYNAPNITKYYSKEFNISITGTVLDDASFLYPIKETCTTELNLTPTITGESGGLFSSTVGLVIDFSTGVIDVSNSIPGTYTVTYTTQNPGSNSETDTITIYQSPVLEINNPAAVCSPSNIDLTANAITNGSSAGTLSYFLDANATSSLANPNQVNTSGTYFIKLTNDLTGCETVKPVEVIINESPVLEINNPAAVCSPSSVDLTANAITNGSSAGTLSYYSDANATSSLANPNRVNTSGTYFIKLTNDLTGCETVKPVEVLINESPVLEINNPAAVCSPSSVDLTANAITNGSSTGTLSYFSDANATSSLANPNRVNTSGTYFIKLTNDLTGCETVKPVEVIINESPVITDNFPANNALDIAINGNLTITFSENILAANGSLSIINAANNNIVETISATATSITNNIVSIAPNTNLTLNTSYYIEISSTAFTNLSGCFFSGIDNTVWNFTTVKNQNNSFLPINGFWSLDSNWSLGRKPIATDNVEIANGRNVTLENSSAVVNNLNVEGIFNLSKNKGLTINGDVNNTGAFTINSGASLIILGNANGNFTYKRTLEANKWYLVGSPVSGQSVVDFINANPNISRGSGTGNDQNIAFAPYNNNTANINEKWTYYKVGQVDPLNETNTSDIIAAGKGYSIRLSSPSDITFVGTLDTQNITEATTSNISAYNLIANPYPSYINSADFLLANSGVAKSLKSQTLWVWNNELNNGLGAYETKITLDNFSIAPGQAFFVEVDNNLSTNFSNSNQNHLETDTFLKTEKSEIKINVSDTTNEKYAQVYFVDGATTDYDNGYDGEVFNGISSNFEVYTSLTSKDSDKRLSIQSLPSNSVYDAVIPLKINASSEKEVTISVSQTNLPNGISIYVEDKLNNKFIKLYGKNNSYQFVYTTEMKNSENFFIHTSGKALNATIDAFENAQIFNVNNTLFVNGINADYIKLELYSLLGKVVYSKLFNSNGTYNTKLPNLPAGVYLVKIKKDFKEITKKIILE
ncbi:Ig-like domain-containing protein [uncultured Polaribacter sp.]|uniref:Ig-like domain-containing protein n=1 Tax=uncultured Polaribacter sp. TaxID=174711 RepID=UPI0026342182|nr:Ig-like domain-containing protein [uncultured Polaribacter sp.]